MECHTDLASAARHLHDFRLFFWGAPRLCDHVRRISETIATEHVNVKNQKLIVVKSFPSKVDGKRSNHRHSQTDSQAS